jgi:hypothetical protein
MQPPASHTGPFDQRELVAPNHAAQDRKPLRLHLLDFSLECPLTPQTKSFSATL